MNILDKRNHDLLISNEEEMGRSENVSMNESVQSSLNFGDTVKHDVHGEGWVIDEIEDEHVWVAFKSLDVNKRIPVKNLTVLRND